MDKVLWNKKYGFTLIELLLVLAIFSIIMGIVLTSIVSYNKRSKVQKNILFMNEDVKSGIYILSNYLQMAGFGSYYSLDMNNEVVNGYNRVLTPGDNVNNGSDSLTVVFANKFIGFVADDNGSNSSQCYYGNKVYIRVDSQSNINLLDNNLKKYVFFDSTPYNQFFQIISGPTTASISTCGTGFSCYSITLNSNLKVCDNDSVYGVRAISFTYDNNSQEIEMNENVGNSPIPILGNIETIQFQYGVDRDDDGNFDDIDGDSNPLDNTVSKNDERYLKLIKVYIMIRTKDPDPDYRDNQTTYQIANHTIQLDTNDSNGINSKYDWHYRRKLIEISIVPRNLLYSNF